METFDGPARKPASKYIVNEVTEKLAVIICDTAGYADITPETIGDETRLDNDLGLDSLDLIEIVLDVEKEFVLSISDDEVADVKTVGDISKVVIKKLSAEDRIMPEAAAEEKQACCEGCTCTEDCCKDVCEQELAEIGCDLSVCSDNPNNLREEEQIVACNGCGCEECNGCGCTDEELEENFEEVIQYKEECKSEDCKQKESNLNN